jgi:hypothetical protein
VKILIEPVPEGSHDFRIWAEIPQSDGDNGEPYQVTGSYHHIDKDTCEVARVLGELSNEVNIHIGLGAIQLGYKKLVFHRSMGGLATRWAELIRRDDGMAYYRVDLVKALEIYKQRGAQ